MLDEEVRYRGMVARMLTVVLGSILETTLVGFAQQRIERFVLARADENVAETKCNNMGQSFDRVFGSGGKR